MPKLTKRVVDSAAPRSEAYILWCSDLPGFGARVFKSGRVSYVADYRSRDGVRRRMSIGHHGKLTTEEARKQAIIVLGSVVKGGDPANDRAARRRAMTVAELCDAYLTAADKGLILGKGGRAKKVSTLATDHGRVERHIKPLIGRKLVADLTTADVNRFMRDVTAGKTAAVVATGKLRGKAVVEGGAGTAARTTGLLGGILSYAVTEGVIAANPARGVRRPADGRRSRRLTVEEYGKLGAALATAEQSREAWQGIAGVRLLALTGCRLGEVVALKWAEVDLTGQALRLEDTKTGASIRPLGGIARDMLKALPHVDGCPYVLPPARGGERFGGVVNMLERAAKRAGLGGVTAHVLRHSFASMAGDLDFAESTIGAMLGHSTATITGRYVHRLDATLIAAADRVAGAVASAMAGEADG